MLLNNHRMLPLFLMITIIAVCAMILGTVLALHGYSSAGAFSVAAAAVGVIGTYFAMNNSNSRKG